MPKIRMATVIIMMALATIAFADEFRIVYKVPRNAVFIQELILTGEKVSWFDPDYSRLYEDIQNDILANLKMHARMLRGDIIYVMDKDFLIGENPAVRDPDIRLRILCQDTNVLVEPYIRARIYRRR